MRHLTLTLLTILLMLQCATAQETPRQAYARYLQVLAKASSMDELAPFWMKERAAAIPKGKEAVALEMMKKMAPSQVQVVKEVIRGDDATLEVKAMQSDFVSGKPKMCKGVLSYRKEGGQWRMGKESWD